MSAKNFSGAAMLGSILKDSISDPCCGTATLDNLTLSTQPGNTLQILSDGLYSAGGGAGTPYDDEMARDAVGAMLSSEFTFVDAANSIGINQIAFSKITGVPSFLLTETDPVFVSSPAYGITTPSIANWNTAYNSRISSVAVTGGSNTKTLTITKADASVVSTVFTLPDSIYNADGSLLGNRLIDVAGYNITFNNSGIFRIKEGDTSVGSIYDFNDGVDFLNYDATYSANIKQNSVTGIAFSVTNVATATILTKFEVTPTGYLLKGVPEYADNAAAIAAGKPIDFIYRTGDTLKVVH